MYTLIVIQYLLGLVRTLNVSECNPGTFVYVTGLSLQKNVTLWYLNERVKCINDSFAVILDPPTNADASRINIGWIFDPFIFRIGVKRRHLRHKQISDTQTDL